MSVWGTSDPTGLTGDVDNSASTGSNAPIAPSPAYPVAGAPDTSDLGLGDILGSLSPGAFEPSSLAVASGGGSQNDLMSLLSLLMGAGGGSSAASSALSQFGAGSEIGNWLSQLLGPQLGLNQGTSSQEGGLAGGVVGASLGTVFGGPGGTFIGSTLGDLLGNMLGAWIGGGLNKFVKPEETVQGLEGSGNTLEQMLGQYIQKYGINRGYDLSAAPGAVPFSPARMGDVLELLSGEKLPYNVGELGGWKQPGYLSGLLANPTLLSANQLQQIMPEMALLVNRSRGENLETLLGKENTLATKLKAAESY